jgi:short-subunit dehydrogenase
MASSHPVALITGASSGIGASLARLLAREGMAVVLAARRKENLRSLAAEITAAGGTALPVQCDVTVREDAEQLVQDALDAYGRLDVLVNNAGRGHMSSVEDTTDEIIESMFAVNVFPLWYTARVALPVMRKQGSGHIITVASMAGKVGYPYNSAYVAAKHAAVGFTHALRQELAETGIHAGVVCPAGVLTEWALVTEGQSMKEFFAESGPAIKRIAEERGLSLPKVEGVVHPDVVAQKILECIRHPVPEVYTHSGSREFVELAGRDREGAEKLLLAVVLGEREVYERLRGGRTPQRHGDTEGHGGAES